MKAITSLKELENWLNLLLPDYEVLVPVCLHDGTRSLDRLSDKPIAIKGGALPVKPTSVFFPHYDKFLSFADNKIEMQKPLQKPLLVIGFTASDAECQEFVDKFFCTNHFDDIYFNKRCGSLIVVVSGRCGKDGEFMKIAGGHCDLELICDGENFIVAPYTDAGKSIASKMTGGIDDALIDELQKESDSLSREDDEIIQKASKLLQEGKVPDEFWAELANRCIACMACNLSCPTCTCFEVFDQGNDRIRMWDSCQLDGFMREASGHSPMGEQSVRVRRRIHHKLAADVTRWDTISCFLCGRCDDVCPVDLGIKTISREIVKNYG